MKPSLFFIIVFLSFISCTKNDLNGITNNISYGKIVEALNEDSLLVNFTALNSNAYSLDITLEDAAALGVSEKKYYETIEIIDSLNAHIQKRIACGDIIQCLPPPKQESIETKALTRRDTDMDVCMGMWDATENININFKGPRYLCGLITGSDFYYSVTISFNNYSNQRYTITSAQSMPNTSIHIMNPSPSLYSMDEYDFTHEDYYDTHLWDISTNIYNANPNNEPHHYIIYLTLIRRNYADFMISYSEQLFHKF